ncbi:hypothetical protein DFP72DRAFT_895435 [Ephemerocybe angulata]|uniref:Uncharacterized protein n=1 Tax=Ephemerocybe angulata TaxID=980116 RepID=A0A8H6HZK0_9AGAR|nr:hypothetical protein DFP72DRAFT_895435 [Tulosesus angulatus]
MPFNDLPREICHDIFMLCIQDLYFNSCSAIEKREGFPLFSHPTFYTSVCKHWAQIALSSPPTLIGQGIVTGGIPDGKPTSVTFLPPLPVVRRSVELSKPSSLAFSVRPWHEIMWKYPNDLYTQAVKPMLEEIFVPHHTRWRRVALQWCPQDDFPFLLDKVPSFPALEHLALGDSPFSTGPPLEDYAAGAIHILSTAPQLNYDFLPGDTCPRIVAVIPWERLTRLSLQLGKLDVSAALNLLGEQCPNLKDLEVTVDHVISLDPELAFMFPDYPSCTATPEEVIRDALVESFQKLIQRSACQLRKLYYSASIHTPHDLESTLMMLRSVSSSLEELEIEAQGVDTLADALSVPADADLRDILCPRLRHGSVPLEPAFASRRVEITRARHLRHFKRRIGRGHRVGLGST